MSDFTSDQTKSIYQAVKDRKQIIVNGQQIEILGIKEADSGEKYAKVHIKFDPNKTQYLEFYWEENSLYFGIDLSEDIEEFLDFNFESFQPPTTLERNEQVYTFTDKGVSTVTESEDQGDYHKGDQIYFWEYFSPDKRSRISLGYNSRSKRWLNMFTKKLSPEEIKIQE